MTSATNSSSPGAVAGGPSASRGRVSDLGSLFRSLASLAAGGALLGLGVVALTVRLDPEIASRRSDVWILLAWGAAFYALGWLLAALVPALISLAVERRARSARLRSLAVAVRAGLVMTPVLYLLLLPQVGLAGDLLSSALFGRGVRRVFAVLAAGLACVLMGWVALRLASWWRGGISGRISERWLSAPGLWAVVASSLVLAAVTVEAPSTPVPPAKTLAEEATAPPERQALASFDFESGELPTQSADEAGPAPVFLLCIDGADPSVLRQLMARGELPTFRRLAQDGVWGELATLRPTLSPVVWTTLISGRTPDDHGIHQFVHFRLPGVRSPILQFPLHSGLNFTLLQAIEDATGVSLRSPYTTAMRRVPALWNIIGRSHAVGVYRWLMTWPAEEVNGYFVSGGIAWAKLQQRRGRTFYPERLRRFLDAPRSAPAADRLDTYFDHRPAEGSRLDRLVKYALSDPTVSELARLTDRYRPRFTAASFFPVDASQHLFGHLRGTEDARAGVVDGFYRLADARLGELLDRLGDDARILVVSDHGYDFAHGHHGNQPPGVFFAHGEGLGSGLEVEGLEVYDIAPLALRLLDLPLAEDMPGTVAGRYRRVLDEQWAEDHPERRIATWNDAAHWRQETDRLVDPEVEEVLRSLGYVE